LGKGGIATPPLIVPMDTLRSFLDRYAELETDIRDRISGMFSETCGICTACCCRVDICEEAANSVFLSMLLDRQNLSESNLDDRYGWLDQHGCSLEYGRPPVCYSFFCNELLARLPNEDARWTIRVLGRLIEHVGENVLPGRHLSEIMKAEDLELIDFEPLMARIDEAYEVLESIDHFLETGRLDEGDREALDAIPLET